MNVLSPKPLIAEVLQSWRIAPGMTFSLISDVERQLWVQESCPIGSHFWSLEQAQNLIVGERTGTALRELIEVGHEYIERQQVELTRANSKSVCGEHTPRRSEVLHLEKQRVAEEIGRASCRERVFKDV